MKSQEVLDTDRRIGQCLGAGMSIEQTAEHIGKAPNTVRNHIDGNQAFIFAIKAEIEALLAVQTSKTVVEVKARAQDRIEGVLSRGLTLTERAIQRAEALGDEITLPELIEIHKNFTVWAAKFSVSEAPKRLEVGGSIDHEHRVLLDETVDSIRAFQGHIQRAIPGGVIDVEPEPAS